MHSHTEVVREIEATSRVMEQVGVSGMPTLGQHYSDDNDSRYGDGKSTLKIRILGEGDEKEAIAMQIKELQSRLEDGS
jgi:hypothetical protein